MREPRLPIRIVCAGAEEAQLLVGGLGGFAAEAVCENDSHEVHVTLDAESSELLLTLFNAIGQWVTEGKADSCQVFFGDRPYTLLAVDDSLGDPTQFLLERTIQLQTALDTRIVIEQAKGVLAERFGLPLTDAFELLRRAARSSGAKIHILAEEIVSSPETPEVVQRVLNGR
jgi:hypothetical protein